MVRNLLSRCVNFLGYRTTRKLVVICSDDWGGIRVKDLKQKNALQGLGINMSTNRFDEFDTIESNQDMEQLFDVLTKYKDGSGNHPVITAVMNVANPDFKKIKSADYTEYFFEPFNETLSNYPSHDRVLDLYKQGIRGKIFKPQFHGREHLQISSWLKGLQIKEVKTMLAFENEFFFLTKGDVNMQMPGEYAEAYNFWDHIELEYQKVTIHSGIDIFKSLLGYAPSYFAAPVFIYNDGLNDTLKEVGIQIIDVPRLRNEPIGQGRFRKRFHYMGQENGAELSYLNRNAVFEPNLPGNGVQRCLEGIDLAFASSKPAVISNHRVSFVGGISESNRSHGLEQLDLLIRSILRKWPDAEFIDAEELSQMIRSHK